MSHGDQVSDLPAGFHVTASTSTAPLAAIENKDKHIYGIQFHPEVTHTPEGKTLLSNFVLDICGIKSGAWSMVDSTVAAKLMSLAIGDRFHAILVDNGVMRLNECKDSLTILRDKLNINLTLVDASEVFLGKLKGVSSYFVFPLVLTFFVTFF